MSPAPTISTWGSDSVIGGDRSGESTYAARMAHDTSDFQVPWTEMQHGTRSDYEYLTAAFEEHARRALVDNLVNMLTLLQGPTLGYQCDRLYSLQSGTRATNGVGGHGRRGVVARCRRFPRRASFGCRRPVGAGVDEGTGGEAPRPFPGLLLLPPSRRGPPCPHRYADSPYFDRCVDFCAEYDQNCFDPNYPVMALEEFRPMLDEVFSRPSRVPEVAPLDG